MIRCLFLRISSQTIHYFRSLNQTIKTKTGFIAGQREEKAKTAGSQAASRPCQPVRGWQPKKCGGCFSRLSAFVYWARSTRSTGVSAAQSAWNPTKTTQRMMSRKTSPVKTEPDDGSLSEWTASSLLIQDNLIDHVDQQILFAMVFIGYSSLGTRSSNSQFSILIFYDSTLISLLFLPLFWRVATVAFNELVQIFSPVCWFE